MTQVRANDLIEHCLTQANEDLRKAFDAEIIFFRSPLLMGTDDSVREYIEEIVEKVAKNKRKNKLCVLIETSGGYIETVERIYSVFRRYFTEVFFVIPNFA